MEMSDEKVEQFENLLSYPDWRILKWVREAEPLPSDISPALISDIKTFIERENLSRFN